MKEMLFNQNVQLSNVAAAASDHTENNVLSLFKVYLLRSPFENPPKDNTKELYDVYANT